MNKTVRASFAELYPFLREAIDGGHSFTFTAFGNSMHPYLRGGSDRVTLSPVRTPLKAGDVVFYRREQGGFVLHRIVRAEKGTLSLCGDNQYVIERGVSEDQVIAVLTERERGGRKKSPACASARIWVFFLPLRRFFLHAGSFFMRRIKKLFSR